MVGLVFFLLFGAISLYLYMYVQQVDQKVNLLESILLDMKVSNEIKGFDVPADNHSPYVPFKDDTAVTEESVVAPADEELKPFIDEDEVEELVVVSTFQPIEPAINYETATLKELQAYAKTKGISVGTMKKSQLIETLKGVEQSGFNGESSAFLETSAPVSNEP
jgi:hypothetical protein